MKPDRAVRPLGLLGFVRVTSPFRERWVEGSGVFAKAVHQAFPLGNAMAHGYLRKRMPNNTAWKPRRHKLSLTAVRRKKPKE
jgi:hypothetical protein